MLIRFETSCGRVQIAARCLRAARRSSFGRWSSGTTTRQRRRPQSSYASIPYSCALTQTANFSEIGRKLQVFLSCNCDALACDVLTWTAVLASLSVDRDSHYDSLKTCALRLTSSGELLIEEHYLRNQGDYDAGIQLFLGSLFDLFHICLANSLFCFHR